MALGNGGSAEIFDLSQQNIVANATFRAKICTSLEQGFLWPRGGTSFFGKGIGLALKLLPAEVNNWPNKIDQQASKLPYSTRYKWAITNELPPGDIWGRGQSEVGRESRILSFFLIR